MRKIVFIVFALMLSLRSAAQTQVVQNRPYTDLRPMHFGVLVGTHAQDLKFVNAGPQMITDENGNVIESLVTTDQNSWDVGFNVGVLAEFRLNNYFALRLAPTLYFGSRQLAFLNHRENDEQGNPIMKKQTLKTVYIAAAADIIYASKRLNNVRPYLMAGVSPMVNLSGNSGDIVRLKQYDCMLEVGMGCDFYLPFFKLRPELKFCFGLVNALDTKHYKEIKDKNLLKYTNSVKEASSRMVVLTFYFE